MNMINFGHFLQSLIDEDVIENVDVYTKYDVFGKENVLKIQFKEDLKNQVKMQKLANSVDKIEVTEKDCEKFYKENPAKFQNPELVRASHILISANAWQIQQDLTLDGKRKIDEADLKAQVEAKMAAKKEQAEKLAKELKADKTKFVEYAKKYSDDPGSAKQGGDLGFFPKEAMVPEFAKVAFDSKPDTVSDVVKTQFGYHVMPDMTDGAGPLYFALIQKQ